MHWYKQPIGNKWMVQLKTLIDDRFAPDSHIMAAMFVKMRTTATDLLILLQKMMLAKNLCLGRLTQMFIPRCTAACFY